MIRLNIVLLLGFLLGCSPATEDFRRTRFTSMDLAGLNNQVTIHFSEGLTTSQWVNAHQSARAHVSAVEHQIFLVAQAAIGTTLPPLELRNVYVYASRLNVPYKNTVGGWVDYNSPGRDIHVVSGPTGTVPNLTRYLSESYFENVPPYVVTIPGLPHSMSFWDYVDFVNDGVMANLNHLFP